MLWYSVSSDQCEGFASRILRRCLKDSGVSQNQGYLLKLPVIRIPCGKYSFKKPEVWGCMLLPSSIITGQVLAQSLIRILQDPIGANLLASA